MKELEILEKMYLLLAQKDLPEVMTSLSLIQAAILATISKSESDLLDGVDVSNKCLRQSSCEFFIKKKKLGLSK